MVFDWLHTLVLQTNFKLNLDLDCVESNIVKREVLCCIDRLRWQHKADHQQ